MTKTIESFSYGKKSFQCKTFSLFLPCNMAAVQKPQRSPEVTAHVKNFDVTGTLQKTTIPFQFSTLSLAIRKQPFIILLWVFAAIV